MDQNLLQEKVQHLVVKSGRLYYQFQVKGRTFSGALDLTDTPGNRILASTIIEEKLRDAKRGIEIAPHFDADRRFDHAAKEFAEWLPTRYSEKGTVRSYISNMQSLIVFFDKTAIHTIHQPEIERYKFWRKKEHQVEDTTLRHNLHVLSVFFKWAKMFGYVKANPFRVEDIDIPSDKDSHHERVITLEEEQRYMELASRLKNQDLWHVARLMLDEGLRPDEVDRLELIGLDESAHTIKIFTGKSRAAKRVLYLTDSCYEILKGRAKRAKALGTRWLFHNERRPMNHIGPINGPHGKVCELMRVRFRPYDFRHTFATRAGENGVDLPTLAYMMGHADMTTLRRYVHPGQAHAVQSMQKHQVAMAAEWRQFLERQRKLMAGDPIEE